MNLTDATDILKAVRKIDHHALEIMFDPIGDGLKKSSILDGLIKTTANELVACIKKGSLNESMNLCVVLSYLLKSQKLSLPKTEISQLIQSLASSEAHVLLKEI